MKNLLIGSLVVACVVGIAAVSTSPAAVVNVAVEEDGYSAMGGSMWLMNKEYCKAYKTEYMGQDYSSWGYIKFAMDTLEKAGGGPATGADIESAALKFYITGKRGAGLTPYGTNETGPFEINAYDGAYANNAVVPGTTVTADKSGGDPHACYAAIMITDIVKGWLDGTYDNYGIKVANSLDDGKGFYWNANGSPDNKPYLEVIGNVELIPEPATMALLVCGGVGLLIRRRSQTRRGGRRVA